MEKKDTHSNKHFDSSKGFSKYGRVKVGPIKKVRSVPHVGDDESVFEIKALEPNGLFRKYKRIVQAESQEKYERCKECVQIHNELASRTYDDVPTSIDVIKELGKKKPLPIEADQKS